LKIDSPFSKKVPPKGIEISRKAGILDGSSLSNMWAFLRFFGTFAPFIYGLNPVSNGTGQAFAAQP
jgi:hypothetical protein